MARICIIITLTVGMILQMKWCLADIKDYTLSVGYRNLSPVGLRKRMQVVNGMFPGPTIRGNKGDILRIRIENHLDDNSTAIHWHGIRQISTPYYDGVPAQNQCELKPGDSTVVQFQLVEAGTTWWHAHSGMQYPEGILGALIIDNPQNPYEYDDEYEIILGDLWQNSTWGILAFTKSQPITPNVPNIEQAPDGGVFCVGPGTCNSDGISVIHFVPGKKYRLRIINAGTMTSFHFSVDGHDMQLIKADLTDLDGSTTVKSFPIHVAQRYDVIITARNDVKSGTTFWMRAEMQTSCYPKQNPKLKSNLLGIVNYIQKDEVIQDYPSVYDKKFRAVKPKSKGRIISKPKSQAHKKHKPGCYDLPLSSLTPRIRQNAMKKPPQLLMIHANFSTDPILIYQKAYVNGISYDVSMSEIPTLLAENIKPHLPIPSRRVAYLLERSMAHIIIDASQSSIQADHPFHLHGHDFKILSQSNGSYTLGEKLLLKNPPRRDTAMVPAGGHLVIEMDVNNPGVWSYHCHLNFHLEFGLMFQLVELPNEIARMNFPDEVFRVCGNVTRHMNVTL